MLDISVPSGLGAGGSVPCNVPSVRMRVRVRVRVRARPGPILETLSSIRSLCDRRSLVGSRIEVIRSSRVSFLDDANNACERVKEIRFAPW